MEFATQLAQILIFARNISKRLHLEKKPYLSASKKDLNIKLELLNSY